ncbi:MAG: glutathione S-transferase family protein [Pseudomonadota bacterium]
MYTVVGTLTSRAFRVLWMLEELGQPYIQIAAKPQSEEVRAHNVHGKIPVLLDEDHAISDSTAIVTYLADKHGALSAPAGTLERAQQDAMTQRILDEFDACLWSAARHSFVLPAEKRVPAVKETLKWEFARAETALVHDLRDKPFLMGEQISVPDIILTHCLGWAITAKFGISEPVLSEYLNRMKVRDAYQQARAKAA